MLLLTNGTGAGLRFGVAGPLQPGTPVISLEEGDSEWSSVCRLSETLEQAPEASGGEHCCLIHRVCSSKGPKGGGYC